MSRMFLRALLLLLALAWLPASAQTRAWLDRAEITYGETVALNIATDQPVAEIDYAPLRAQFEIGGQSVRRSYALVNGQARRTSVFSVGLRPRAPGLASVPALRVGNASTAPLRLVVLEPAVQPASANADVFVETSVDALQPYVQQAVGVTVRLNYAVPLLSGQLELEPPARASLQRVGEDITYERMLGGRRYSVVERRFLLIPERSGPLLLAGARLNGITGGGFSGPLFEDDRQPLSAAAPDIRLQVRPIPANAPQPWLPLHRLALRYLQAPTQAFAGQAAEIELEMLADGATAGQVPALELGAVADAQVFAEPPRMEVQFVDGRPRTTVRRRFSLVPSKPGPLAVPGPRIRWWDAGSGTARLATLPPLQLQVAAGANVGGAEAPPAPAGGGAAADARKDAVPRTAVMPPRWLDWKRASVWLLPPLLLLLVALAVIAARRRRARIQAGTSQPSRGPAAASPPSLEAALHAGDFGDIRRALAAQAGLQRDDFDTLLARLEDPAQVQALRRVQAARWGGGDQQAALQGLRAAFAGGARWRPAKRSASSLLPPLYPD